MTNQEGFAVLGLLMCVVGYIEPRTAFLFTGAMLVFYLAVSLARGPL